MIRTTLKANKDHGVDYIDIAYYTEENWTVVADLFDNPEKYHNKWDETDWDKLYAEYTPRQVASACLKHLRSRTKGKYAILVIWNGYFIDLDCDGEIAYGQIEALIQDGEITGSDQLREIQQLARKKGRTIKKGERYGENNAYFRYVDVDDLIDAYFPCYAEAQGTKCNNCGNCTGGA